MSTDLDPKVADEASADEPIDQAMEFNTVRYRGLTHVTVTDFVKMYVQLRHEEPGFLFARASSGQRGSPQGPRCRRGWD